MKAVFVIVSVVAFHGIFVVSLSCTLRFYGFSKVSEQFKV